MGYDPDSVTIGFYGKLPARGDFLTRHLPRKFVSVWDDWLQTGLNDSRNVLNERWLDIYLTSPLWRFALSGGICGDGGWAGVMLPSMDRVGRYFPFTVAMSLPETMTPLGAAITQRDWFRQVEELSLAALDDDDIDPGTLDEDLAAVSLEAGDEAHSCEEPSPVISPADLSTGVRVPLGKDLDSSRIVIGMACAWLDRQVEQHSLWWTEGSEVMSPSLLCHPGLPTAKQFCALLDGSWADQGWSDPAGSPQSSEEPDVVQP